MTSRVRERLGSVAPDHFEPQPPDRARFRKFFVDEPVQSDTVVHASPVPYDAHADLYPGCLSEQRPTDLVRTLDDVLAEPIGVHVRFLFKRLRTLRPWSR